MTTPNRDLEKVEFGKRKKTMATVIVDVYIHAPVEKVWEIISDHGNFTRFPGVTSAQLLKTGEKDRNGTGAVREIHSRGAKFVEEIINFDPPYRYDYKVMKCNMPIEHDHGWMKLIPRGEGTEVRWESSFRYKIPLLGDLFTRLARIIGLDLFFGALLSCKEDLELSES